MTRFSGQLQLGPDVARAVKVRPEYAQPVDGNSENDSAKPRGEFGRVAQKIEIQPGTKERFLSYVLCLEPIVEQDARQTPSLVLITQDEFAIGVPISGPCQVDQVGVVFRVHLLHTD